MSFLQPNSMPYSDFCLFSTVVVTISAQNLKCSAVSWKCTRSSGHYGDSWPCVQLHEAGRYVDTWLYRPAW